LWVGGIGVGRGYLHDPERTAAAFVPDPFDGRPGARLYRTGDRGRRLPDGSLECLGRLDQQVKIRGMRIEPGEIEAVLVQHPAVRQAVVVARIDRGADARLVAYVAALDPPPALVEALRRFLAERLPDFMVPSLFIVLAALPLSANGKIDRHALPEPAGRSTDPTVVSRRPETAIERLLMDIWSEVLGVDVTSVDDGFLALGGDSLSSLRVVAEARQHGIVVTPTQLFEQQTIARLAAVATTAVGPRADQDLVSGAVDLTPVQRMFFDADLPAVHHYNMAVLLEVPDDLAPSLLAIAVEHLLRHHDALRLRFRRDAEGWQQSIAGLDGVVPFSHVELSSQADGAVQPAIAAVANELQASLNLADGPIIRVALFGFGPDRPGRVLIVIHHLACDIVSWPILLADLASLYDRLCRGDAIALPPKTSSYQQWARRLLEYGRRPDHAHELDFWRRECADPGARLPRDLPGPDATIADLEHVRSVLAPAQTERVRSVAAAAGVSVEVMLLTALATAVTERAGGDALLVYLERHGREALFPDLDVARTVGWFTAVFPVRLRVAPSRRPEETLRLIARHLTEIPSGGVGYGVMRYADHDPDLTAALRALPRPEVSFNYLGRIDPPERARWRLARESPGREFSMRGARPTILDVTAQVADGGLHVAWAYGAALHRRATIEQLAGRFLDVIMQIGRGTS
jgi:non-ribosomal peptide synthase protein (TIGR01720 family)